MNVFINPGHDPAADSGACANGLRECDVTLALSLFLAKYLKAADVGISGFLQSDDLAEVCSEANSSGADVFLSLHCNAADYTSASGVEALVYADGGTAGTLGRYILAQLRGVGFNDRGIKERPHLWVLRGTRMPAVLVECGFLTNEADATLLATHPEKVAAAVAVGITDYLCRRR